MSEEQEKEWWQQGYGYRVQSGIEISGDKCLYSVITDIGNGFTYFEGGNKGDIVSGSSTEVVGKDLNSKEVAKIIKAVNGDIEFWAPGGQITLKAKNIRIVAEDGDGEITMQAGKILEADAPTSRVKGTNVDITAVSGANVMGNYADVTGGVQQSSSSLTDLTQGSLVGALLNALGNLKKFLSYFA